MTEIERLHVMAEGMKLALPTVPIGWVILTLPTVPRGLMEPGYATALLRISTAHMSLKSAAMGCRPDWEKTSSKSTPPISRSLIAEGNWVACTATVNTSFGSKVVIPETRRGDE